MDSVEESSLSRSAFYRPDDIGTQNAVAAARNCAALAEDSHLYPIVANVMRDCDKNKTGSGV